MRVRGFTQDDGHIFCTEDQIESETADFISCMSKFILSLALNLLILNYLPDQKQELVQMSLGQGRERIRICN